MKSLENTVKLEKARKKGCLHEHWDLVDDACLDCGLSRQAIFFGVEF